VGVQLPTRPARVTAADLRALFLGHGGSRLMLTEWMVRVSHLLTQVPVNAACMRAPDVVSCNYIRITWLDNLHLTVQTEPPLPTGAVTDFCRMVKR
jgi:hypothetical protein